jgi:hypothetical protein
MASFSSVHTVNDARLTGEITLTSGGLVPVTHIIGAPLRSTPVYLFEYAAVQLHAS